MKLKTLLFAVLGLCLSTSALANTITVTPTPTIAGVGPYTWTYAVSLEGQSQINPGDFFTIFDFAGLLPGTQNAPAGWTPSAANVGLCPAQPPFPTLCALADDPAVPNLTWTRTGGVIVGPGAGASVVLGQFMAQSAFNLVRNDFFVSQDQDNQTVPPSPMKRPAATRTSRRPCPNRPRSCSSARGSSSSHGRRRFLSP